MKEYFRARINISRGKAALLYLLTYAIAVVSVALPGLKHISDTCFSLCMVAMYFPAGLFYLFGEPKYGGSLLSVLGYVFYASLASIGIASRNRIPYVLFVLLLILNIEGCNRGLSSVHW